MWKQDQKVQLGLDQAWVAGGVTMRTRETVGGGIWKWLIPGKYPLGSRRMRKELDGERRGMYVNEKAVGWGLQVQWKRGEGRRAGPPG